MLPHRLRERTFPLLSGGDPLGFGEIRPAFELAVNGFAPRQHAHARGEFLDRFSIGTIAHTHRDPVEPAKHIEFRHRQAYETVHAHGHPEHHETEPTAAPRPSAPRAVFASAPFA